jgi:hypothetical protein
MALVGAGSLVASAASMTYNLSLDTSQLAATNANYQLEFDLSGTAGNTVVISNPDFGTGAILRGQTLPITLHSSLQNFGEFQTLGFTPGTVAIRTRPLCPRRGSRAEIRSQSLDLRIRSLTRR